MNEAMKNFVDTTTTLKGKIRTSYSVKQSWHVFQATFRFAPLAAQKFLQEVPTIHSICYGVHIYACDKRESIPSK